MTAVCARALCARALRLADVEMATKQASVPPNASFIAATESGTDTTFDTDACTTEGRSIVGTKSDLAEKLDQYGIKYLTREVVPGPGESAKSIGDVFNSLIGAGTVTVTGNRTVTEGE